MGQWKTKFPVTLGDFSVGGCQLVYYFILLWSGAILQNPLLVLNFL